MRRILDAQEGMARDELTTHRLQLDQLAALLITQETVLGPELESLLSGVRLVKAS